MGATSRPPSIAHLEVLVDVGMIGLGAMGRNFVLNMAEHGFGVVGFDRDAAQVAALRAEAGGRPIRTSDALADLVRDLPRPRVLFLLVPAGAPVDAVLRELLPLLSQGDLIIDGGNSHFHDTDIRLKALSERRIEYLGVGVSGGSEGARHGPSLMPGGSRDAYERVRPLFEAVAARVNGEPCVAWCGPGSAGHYVKMVHNGIEYGLMQLIAEAYDFSHRGLGMTNDELHDVFDGWNQTELKSFLIEITARIFEQPDPATGSRLIDVILDEARQKGTGMWTSQEAMALQVPVPTIDMAVAMRDLSVLKAEREAASKLLGTSPRQHDGKHEVGPRELRNALFAATIMTYAQGMALLRRGSTVHGYSLNLSEIARIWRGGCIIRAAVLDQIRATFEATSELTNLLLDPGLFAEIQHRQSDLRLVVRKAAEQAIPVPGLMASLAYWDSYCSVSLPANLIQAQRDYFGAHTYERIDAKGTFHTVWHNEG
ncbi:MAG: NADP-dependent phosphogluconate dehydrogenase [Deltaproteobacteria bacterium]